MDGKQDGLHPLPVRRVARVARWVDCQTVALFRGCSSRMLPCEREVVRQPYSNSFVDALLTVRLAATVSRDCGCGGDPAACFVSNTIDAKLVKSCADSGNSSTSREDTATWQNRHICYAISADVVSWHANCSKGRSEETICTSTLEDDVYHAQGLSIEWDGPAPAIDGAAALTAVEALQPPQMIEGEPRCR